MNGKRFAGAVAIFVAFAIAVSAWAQGPAPSGRHYGGFSGSSSNPGEGPMATAAPSPPVASAAPQPHHAVRQAHRTAVHRAAAAGDTAAQLNREELARIQSGGSPHP